MLFLSLSFLALFAICFIFCYTLNGRYRNVLLLLTSFVFIGWYHLAFLITAIAVALYTFFMAQWIEQRSSQDKPVGTLYTISIVGLIIGWLFFHYSSALLGVIPFTSHVGLKEHIIIPLGLSFYTFQAIGYLTDVYWQEQRAERNPVDFMLFMLFFMKFLSGPIERGNTMLGQLKNPKPFEYSSVVFGLKLILLGLIKKLLIANHIAPYTDMMFSSIHELSGIQLLMTCLIYPIELYADFSGYTDIAIGGACMLGIELSPNFNSPFASRSTSELWRRWHMSLSFWVRDYLYVPLTASTRGWGQWGVFFSLIVTFVSLGVWHGAGWTFAIYGLIQGLIICWETKFPFLCQNLHKAVGQKVANAIMMIRTYLLFAFSLIFFRISSIHDALYFLRNISFSIHRTWKEINIGMSDHSCIVVGSSLVLLLVYEYFTFQNDLMKVLERKPTWFRWSVYYLLIFVLFTLGKFGTDSFIYLQF
jgi:Predicted membrane protein involved in D-alanine export